MSDVCQNCECIRAEAISVRKINGEKWLELRCTLCGYVRLAPADTGKEMQ